MNLIFSEKDFKNLNGEPATPAGAAYVANVKIQKLHTAALACTNLAVDPNALPSEVFEGLRLALRPLRDALIELERSK